MKGLLHSLLLAAGLVGPMVVPGRHATISTRSAPLRLLTDFRNSNDTTLIGAGLSETAQNAQDFWALTATTGAPTARSGHTAVWTGTKMIVWGGLGATFVGLNSGGLYDPLADSWTATTTGGAPAGRSSHTAVWTGTKMIVWGGATANCGDGCDFLNTGGQYDPVADSWTATTASGAPTARFRHTAVWTGTRMIVWGGSPGPNAGGQYDPVTDSWTATTASGEPAGRSSHTAVWTGAKMIVWGGFVGFGGLSNTGGRYDPIADSWTATTRTGAPAGRAFHTAVWTGTKMIVWGGSDGAFELNTGGQYDPVGDSWTATSPTGAPAGRSFHTAVWTGTKMIVWGGFPVLDTGGQYDPVADSWIATTTTGAPTARSEHTAVWTGTKMIVWGGSLGDNTGGQYSLLPLQGTCTGDATTLCLGNGRFRVQALLTSPDGRTGSGQAAALTADTGYFWFFSPGNVELVVKVLNACGLNQRFWVFAGGLTNVQVDLTVTDMQTGAVRSYRNPQGTAFQPIQDTDALATCP